jgi:hypothetical protein
MTGPKVQMVTVNLALAVSTRKAVDTSLVVGQFAYASQVSVEEPVANRSDLHLLLIEKFKCL